MVVFRLYENNRWFIPFLKLQFPLSSFRPISLSPFLSKLLEQVWYHQLLPFLYKNKIIPAYQSGFRQGYSTTTSLLYLSDSVIRSFDEGFLSALISLDFSKAFDIINHDLFITKLYHYRFSGPALSLLRFFLTNRYQRVIVHNLLPILSSPRSVPLSVPQGSVVSVVCRLYMYADDFILKSFKLADSLLVVEKINNDLVNIAALMVFTLILQSPIL